VEAAKSGLVVKPVLSKAAERWIDGEVDSATYFAEARRAAAVRARAEVDDRLRRNHAGNFFPWVRLGEYRPAE
jgi:hypothetical protein